MYALKYDKEVRGGGTYLYSQHSGGRDRQNSEFGAILVYVASSRMTRTTLRNPVSKKQKTSKSMAKKIVCVNVSQGSLKGS